MDRFDYERSLIQQGYRSIAGVDEAGRGPLAGPVVVAAVIFPVEWVQEGLPSDLEGLNDSKKLSEKRRDTFFHRLQEAGDVQKSVVVVEPEEIDALNILRATHVGMVRAVEGLATKTDHVLVDGLPVAMIPGEQTALVKGDSKSFSIAAASIMAKVTRDRLMVGFDHDFPEYGFAQNKGYPTRSHLEALERHGPCRIHRQSFAPVRQQQLDLF